MTTPTLGAPCPASGTWVSASALPLHNAPVCPCLSEGAQGFSPANNPSSRKGFSPGPSSPFHNRMDSTPRTTTEPIDTHDKIEPDTKQSGASRTAPFNASLELPAVQPQSLLFEDFAQ
jgi:hypothetical protein